MPISWFGLARASPLPMDIVVIDELIHETVRCVVAAMNDMPGVVAVALGGSTASGLGDAESDLDVYLFWRTPLAPPEERVARLRAVADPGSIQVDVHSWGLEDWLTVRGRKIELVYLYLDDLRAQIEQAYGEGVDGEGFTTALLYSVARSQPYYDPTGELQLLRDRLNASYPEPTYQALLRRRSPLLAVCVKDILRAQRRGDLLLVQRRRDTHQAIWFNLLFALNRCYHPGEKRLLIHGERCPIRPQDLATRWLHIAQLPCDGPALTELMSALNDDLVVLIEQHSGITVSERAW